MAVSVKTCISYFVNQISQNDELLSLQEVVQSEDETLFSKENSPIVGNYFDLISDNNSLIKDKYVLRLENLGFENYQPSKREQFFYDRKFKDYLVEYFYKETEKGSILFVYGSLKKELKQTKHEFQNPTPMNNLRKEMMSILQDLKKIMNGDKVYNAAKNITTAKNKPLERAIFQFAINSKNHEIQERLNS